MCHALRSLHLCDAVLDEVRHTVNRLEDLVPRHNAEDVVGHGAPAAGEGGLEGGLDGGGDENRLLCRAGME